VLVDLPSHALVALLWVAMPSLALSDFGVSFICLQGYHDQIFLLDIHTHDPPDKAAL